MEGKTNAVRMLERGKIPFTLREYQFDLEDLSGEHMAAVNNLPLESVFKTIVLKGDKKGYLVCLVNAADSIDLKKAAKISGNKAVELVPVSELEKLTGYVRGGCSPIGMKKVFPTYASDKILKPDMVYVSAGRRGLQLVLKAADLIRFCSITVGDLIQN